MTPNNKVSYCINTFICSNTINPGHEALHCANCGANLLVGDRYRLIEIINQENSDPSKLVYRAIDTLNNQQVILKIIDTPKAAARKYLKREYDFLSMVGSPFPSIQKDDLFEWRPDPEHDFFVVYVLVLPFIEGEDSADWIRENGPISENECINWIVQILAYLEIMSELSVMHRDIKPENIIVCPDQSLKLIDFGSARRIDEEYMSILEETASVEDGSDIRRATRIFTFGYSPPEQLRGQAVKQSDYYAFGKTIIFWLSGKAPKSLIGDDDDAWIHYCPNTSQTFFRFIQWLTAKKVGSRPLAANAIRQYLEERYPIDLEGERQAHQRKKSSWISKILIVSAFFLLVGPIGAFGMSQFFLWQAGKSIDSSDYQRALEELKYARSLNPFSDEVVKKQAYAYLWSNNSVKAKEKFEHVLKRNPDDPDTLYHLGILNEKLDQDSLAQEFYRRSLEAEPLQIEPQMRLARIALRDIDYKTAQEYLDQVLQKIKDYPEKEQPTDQYFINFYLGWLEFGKGNYDVAYKKLRDSLSNTTNDNQNVSVRPGDIVCLLAETTTILEKKQEALSLWSECFMTPTATEIGTNLRRNRKYEFIKKSLE